MQKTIYLAGGCFWGVEAYFKRVKGVLDTQVGYANGKDENATYANLKNSLHAETVKVVYDSEITSVEELVLHLFKIIDPTSLNKQGNDVGVQYRTGVYYQDVNDYLTIEKLFSYLKKQYNEFHVELKVLNHFIDAEAYHQDYLTKNPTGYCHVNLNTDYSLSKDDYQIIKQVRNELKLSQLSYDILKNSATERPHTSVLNNEYRRGIYVEKITGEPLFSSSTKFNSGCGWPSFSEPIFKDTVKYLDDTSHNMFRIEVRSGQGDHHLGHVFNDGPKDMGGKRYCINGAAIDFIPYEEMDEKGYSEFKKFVK